jgi:hypothetical protein
MTTDRERFEKWANKQSDKGKDIRITLMKQGDLAQFRREYGVTKHIPKTYCPVCGYKQLYEKVMEEILLEGASQGVCRECKSEVVILIIVRGQLPEEKMVLRAMADANSGEQQVPDDPDFLDENPNLDSVGD